MQEPFSSEATEDDERLAQLIGPSRAMLARVDALVMTTQRSMSRCLFGIVFCLSGAVAAGVAAVIVVAPGYDKAVVIVAAVVLVACAALFGYAIALLRFDLIPLNTFGQELRGGLRTAEQSLFEERPEFVA